jgi:cytochrome P450 PksS
MQTIRHATPTIPNSPYPIFGMTARANPHPIYAQMRREMPVVPIMGPESGSIFYFITRYDDCVTTLKQPQIGKDYHVFPDLEARYGSAQGEFAMIDRHLLNLDPPDHTRLRGLVHKAFTPSLIENLRGRIQTIADDLIDRALAKNTGDFDLIADYGFPLPITVIAELLGVPAADQDKFREWTRALLFSRDVEFAQRSIMEFLMYMNDLIDQRTTQPQADLLTGLVQAEESGETLDRQELISMIFLLLVAGHETTVNLIGNGMMALFEFPDQRATLQAQPDLIKPAIEEMLRYNGPVETATIRFAFDDVVIGGVEIPRGVMVLVALHAANRDAAVFANPDRLDIMREPNKHIAFGNGIHYCLGAPLARMEGAIAINTLLRRMPNVQPAPGALESLEWNESILLHGVKQLRVTF